jgi:hypothetical protein
LKTNDGYRLKQPPHPGGFPALDQRAQAILLARNSGMTFRQIGRAHGLTTRQVENIYAKTLERRRLDGTPAGELSARLRNAIRKDGCAVTPSDVVAHFTLIDLARMPNVGARCIRELQEWLARHGQKEIV